MRNYRAFKKVKIMLPKILIAGATGTNGRELVAQLTARSIPVRILARDPERAQSLAADGIEIVRGDLTDRASLEKAMEGIEKAYVVTAIRPDTVELFSNFFTAAQKAGVGHVVKFSGLGADLSSSSTVIRQHAQSDTLLTESGLDYTILRPNSFYQNMLWQAEAIRSGGAFYMPLADARQTMIDVRDIAEITAKILTEPGHTGKVYDLTGPQSLNFHDVAAAIGEVIGKPVAYVPISTGAAEDAMRTNGMPEWDAHVLAEIQAAFATGAYAAVDPTAEQLLGRTPRSFGDFIADHKAAFV
jgi:uncharacterized protein YbjT (DUF2867 family)